MPADTIDHSTLIQLVEAGNVCDAHVVTKTDGFVIEVTYGQRNRVLKAQRSGQERRFKKMETLMSYLKGIGISKFDVDMVSVSPAEMKTTERPDRSEALRKTHAASADYDQWFLDQVDKGIRLADAPDAVWISNEDAQASWRKKRNELLARAGSKS